MPTTFTINDIELLGYSEPEIVYFDDSSPYSIFKATAVAGLEEIPTFFIYLKSYCKIVDARVACRKIKSLTPHKSHKYYVVKPDSLQIPKDRLGNIFQTRIYEHEKLVWKTLKGAFSQYLDSLSCVPTEKYFVSPRSEDENIGDRLEDVLMGYMRGTSGEDNGTLYVLSAHASVGKTTVSRQLLHNLANLARHSEKIQTIPVYVEAEHWKNLHLDSIDELWDVINNSLQFFSSELSIRKELFFHALRQGYISFIFDGFDELCGQRNSPLGSVTVLQQLANIASKSEARILVTTRTLYWDSEIQSPPANVSLVQLERFNEDQAREYFSRYFDQDCKNQNNKLRRANEVYGRLVEDAAEGGIRTQFFNLPLCVAMIAVYVESGGMPITPDNGSEIMENFLLNICMREIERKKLNTSPANQFLSFQEIAIMDDERINPEFEFNMLEATNIHNEDIKKLVDHPFLQKIDEVKYRFSYEFLGPYFRALSIRKSFKDLEHNDSVPAALFRLINVMAREADGKGYVFEQLNGLLSPEDLTDVARATRTLSVASKKAASFLTHICRKLVERDQQYTTRTEKTEALFGGIFGTDFMRNKEINEWEFYGVIDRLDFRSVNFHHCKFENVTFRNCIVDNRTVFQQCEFSGDLEIIRSLRGWGDVQINEDCRMNFPTNFFWGEILGTNLGSREEQMQTILRHALGRFWHHGRIKLSMRLEDWRRGPLSRFKISGEILNIMKDVELINEYPISGESGVGIEFDSSSLSDLKEYMDNQLLQGKIKEVFQILTAK